MHLLSIWCKKGGEKMENQINNQFPQQPRNTNPNIATKPVYLQTWFISMFFALSFLIIPLIIGIVLLIMQSSYEKNQSEKYKMIDNAEAYRDNALYYANEIKKQSEIEYQDMKNAADNYANYTRQKAETESQEIIVSANNYSLEIRDNAELEIKKRKLDADNYVKSITQKGDSIKREIADLRSELNRLSEDILIQTTIIPIDEAVTSEEYKSKYNILLIDEKELIKSGRAIEEHSISTTDKKSLNNSIKQILRCFNSEVNNTLSSITVKNIDSVKSKILKTYEVLNKLFETSGISIRKDFLELKLKQADLMYLYEYQKEQERLQQKAIKEQMIEEEKVRREIEKEKSKIEKEERQFKNEINKLMEYLRESSDIEKQLYVDKIKELEEKLALVEKDKENVLDREQNTRAGFVYVISNIGSFGDDVYKIGMTRRLEPMDRINELSNASVPFDFDVHAMIFSEDAPTLENTLHKYFDTNKVNKVNPRKEFYKVSLSEIERVVKENFNGTVTFTKVAEAYQYRESLKLSQQI